MPNSRQTPPSESITFSGIATPDLRDAFSPFERGVSGGLRRLVRTIAGRRLDQRDQAVHTIEKRMNGHEGTGIHGHEKHSRPVTRI